MHNDKYINDAFERAQRDNLYIKTIEEGKKYIVCNYDTKKEYYILIKNGVIQRCTCPHLFFHDSPICKHQVKVFFYTGFKLPL